MKTLKGLLFLSSLAIVGGGGYLAGSNRMPFDLAALRSWRAEKPATSETKPVGRVIYYRHPDGRAEYSATSRKADDGRDFKAVSASEDVSFDTSAKTPITDTKPSAAGEKRIVYYRNPMGLADTSPVPKKDSMGMDYIAVFDGENADSGTVKVSPGKLQRTSVKSVIVALQPVGRKIRVPGTVVLDERRISVITMRTEAFVEDVADVTTGDHVKKGEPLFQFYSRDIASAGAELASQHNTESASSNGGVALKLRNYGLSPEAIDAIRKGRKVPDRMAIDAPVSGVVLERMAVSGMMANPGDLLFRIADTSKLWVIADVAESQLGEIKEGAKATVTIRSLPDKVFKGTVSLIYPEIRMETRTAKVRIVLDNPLGELLANMFADVEIESGVQKPVVSVPNSAIIDTGDRQMVFIDLGEGRFEPKNVKLGMRGEKNTQVTDGVQAGDRVVVAANFLLDAESNLNSALNAMESGDKKQ